MKAMENPHVRTLFAHSPFPMWVCDVDSQQVLDINEPMLRWLNYSREEFFALSTDEHARIFEYSGVGQLDDVWDDLQRDGSANCVFNCRIRDGQEVQFRVTSTLVVDPSGDCLVWCQAERLLSDLSERFSHWFDDQETNIFYYRHKVNDGKLIDLSDSFERILGISREKAIGQSWGDIVQWEPETISVALAKLAAMRPGTSDRMDMQFIHPDGQQRTIKVVSHMFIDEHGEVYIDGQAEDITERKEMEQALRRAREEADHANREKSAFLAQMSHELRTPLNAIVSFSQLLEVENLAPGHRSLLQDIRHSSEHLLQLINDLLDLARIESGRIDLDIVPVDIARQIDDVIRILLPVAQENEVCIAERSFANAWICADEMRIRQILINLLSNAIKYNRQGGSVYITADLVGIDRLRISIEDTGRGIAEEFREHLFEPFERFHATSSDVEGTGLGLVIVKQLVELMSGKIGFQSVENKGSTFWFDLPVAEEAGETRQKRKFSEGVKTQEVKKNDAHVLYIEDNQINTKIVEHIFRRYFSIEIQTATSAREGLQHIRSSHTDLVLLDIDLPDMNGYEVLKEISTEEQVRAVPIIALTGHADWEDRDRGLRAGFTEYLTKPLDIERLVEVVSEVLVDRKNHL